MNAPACFETPHAMALPLAPAASPESVRQQRSLLAAVRLCIQLSGRDPKQLYLDLSIDKGHWSRILAGQAHFPLDKLEHLMDLCGNDVPLEWLSWRRGKGLHLLESTQQRLMREKDDRIAELEAKLRWTRELVAPRGEG